MSAPHAWITGGAIASAAARIGVPVEQYRARVEAGMRWCSGHARWEPTSAFGWRAGRAGVLFRLMPSCPEGHRLASREGMRRTRERRRTRA